jgi:acylphosphatase
VKHVVIHISGRVQGVFFRASTKEKADELSIKGTVKNNVDGSVTVHAEGDDVKMEKFMDWCSQGPPMARVEFCQVLEALPQNFTTFSITR